MSKRGQVHLVIGPVGAGKTTWARREASVTQAIFFDLDEWMVRLYGDDERPREDVLSWYLERRERCRKLIWDTASRALDCNLDVFLELGLVHADERIAFYQQVVAADFALAIYLLEAPRDVRRERVEERNLSPGTFGQVVPLAFFEAASDAWDEVSLLERETWRVIDVRAQAVATSS